MYQFVDATWNPIKGVCQHDCSYCYMKVFPLGKLRLDEKELKVNLDEATFIFVGSSTDMWADNVPYEWIDRVLERCRESPAVKYLFQTKDPSRFLQGVLQGANKFPPRTVLGTTIETNRDISSISKAPSTERRAFDIGAFHGVFETMVTIEPVLDFDLEPMVELIKIAEPTWVNIGADSKGHHLPEPSKDKIEQLITELKKFTEVRQKKNIKRLYDSGYVKICTEDRV